MNKLINPCVYFWEQSYERVCYEQGRLILATICQLVVNCWFGAWWFGFLESPDERDWDSWVYRAPSKVDTPTCRCAFRCGGWCRALCELFVRPGGFGGHMWLANKGKAQVPRCALIYRTTINRLYILFWCLLYDFLGFNNSDGYGFGPGLLACEYYYPIGILRMNYRNLHEIS